MKDVQKNFTVVLETQEFLLVDKAAGVSFQGEEGGLLSQIRDHYGSTSIYPTHRLDKITTGLLLLAKSKAANSALSLAFAERRVEKYYLAISDLKPKKKQGVIVGDMARARRGDWQLTRGRVNPAITQFFSYSLSPGLRLFLLKPHTGKTHQLRVALKSIGAPVLGDPRYHSLPKPDLKPDRGYLHSYALRFELFGECYSQVLVPVEGGCFSGAGARSLINDLSEPWEKPWPSLPKIR